MAEGPTPQSPLPRPKIPYRKPLIFAGIGLGIVYLFYRIRENGKRDLIEGQKPNKPGEHGVKVDRSGGGF